MTFSIVARCEQTRHLGVALATGLPAGGAHCVFAAGSIGAVASQAYANPYLGMHALQQLRDGAAAADAVASAVADDPDPGRRQLIVIDAQGTTAGHTGGQSFVWHGHHCEPNMAMAANMVPTERLLEAVGEEFAVTRGQPLWWRLARALAAGERAERPALRPCRSAVVRVVSTEEYPLLEARVDASDDPIAELLDVVGTVEQVALPFTEMLPTRDEPAGTFDEADLEARGLMPDPPAGPGPPAPDPSAEAR